jgi:hypothetical protein
MVFMRAFLVVVTVFASSVALAQTPLTPGALDRSQWRFSCDGTDPELLEEVDEAFRSGVGYGETWDESICDEGLLSVYAEGVTSRWPAWRRPKKPAPPPLEAKPQTPPIGPDFADGEKRLNDQFFALFLPVFGAGAFGFAVLIAAVIGLFLRLRKSVVVDVACPGCKMPIPFVVGESLHLFCPGCGAASRVDLHVDNKITSATAIPL